MTEKTIFHNKALAWPLFLPELALGPCRKPASSEPQFLICIIDPLGLYPPSSESLFFHICTKDVITLLEMLVGG